jgi:DNA-binding phage protein
VKNENKPATAEKEKTMKLEEIKNKTNEAVSYLVAALESGESEVLTQYLNAMARFHHYSFGNIMLIARQRAVTCCYTSLESMNMRSCALLEASDGA